MANQTPPLSLPDLEAEGTTNIEIVADNIRALQPAYVSAMFVELKVFPVLDLEEVRNPSPRSLPQRGYDLKPNVAASATLGNGERIVLNRSVVASWFTMNNLEEGATALRLKDKTHYYPT